MAKVRRHPIAAQGVELSYIREAGENLGQPKMRKAIAFMRKRFLANPDPIRVHGRDLALSKILASEGALKGIAENTL